MNTRDTTSDYRLAQWAKMAQDREDSGMTIKAYCESIGIREHVYYYRLQKLRETACRKLMKVQGSSSSIVPSGFAEVKLKTHSVMSLSTALVQNHVCIEAGGMRISASCEYPIEKLTALLREAVNQC